MKTAPVAPALTKRPYPPLVEHHHYIVERGQGRNQHTLYSGASPYVARLIVNTMAGARLSDLDY